MDHPKILLKLPSKTLIEFRKYYANYDRTILNTTPEMVKYDPELYYTLKPGSFRFKNREFNVNFQVNSLGVRDQEEDLMNPEVLILGDSLAMGWGVEQNETFADQLQARSGKRVLNLSVSSYGTARELGILKRFLEKYHPQKIKTIIIQYCGNDLLENINYSINKNSLEISSEADFNYRAKYQDHLSRYFLFKHLAFFLLPNEIWKVLFPMSPPEEKLLPQLTKQPSEYFLNVLREIFKIKNMNAKIVLLHLEGWGNNKPDFLQNVAMNLNFYLSAKEQNRLFLIDSSKILTTQDYFILDDHLKFEGHEKLATSLIPFL